MKDKKKLISISADALSLSSRTKLAIDDKQDYYIIKNIKSRIIMSDGKKILDIAKKIKKKKNAAVFLATTAPLCSKTKKYLKENKIEAIFDYIIS
tara:strand:- start:1215 stop:1499 length:285 start_codon:yes stop_codon:yes gene_type:complete